VYYKIAGGSEPTSYAWSMSGATFGVGGICAANHQMRVWLT